MNAVTAGCGVWLGGHLVQGVHLAVWWHNEARSLMDASGIAMGVVSRQRSAGLR